MSSISLKKMSIIACGAVMVMICMISSVQAAPLTEEQYEFLFTRYVEQYDKQYELDHFFSKYNTFKSNLNAILAHNAKGDSSYTLAMNQFGDMTSSEFSKKMLKLKHNNHWYSRSMNTADFSNVRLQSADADSFDWRSKGGVTPVKNQGQCGSCWAFSATGSIEGAHFAKNNKLVTLSEQQLVDCAGSTGNEGCNGGLMDSAFEYVINNGGICVEADYPYTARDGACKTSCKSQVKLSGYKNVASGNEGDLLKAVAIVPVSVAIQADQMAFQFYSGGVFDAACGTALNHGVLAVGYGIEGGKPYWIVKNSWGASWGEKGYIRMVRNKNQCGIALDASYAISA